MGADPNGTRTQNESKAPDVVIAAHTFLRDATWTISESSIRTLAEIGYSYQTARQIKSLLMIAEHQDAGDVSPEALLGHYRIVVGIMASRVLNPLPSDHEGGISV